METKFQLPYGISIAGFKPNLITKPLVHQIPVVKTLLLFHTDHENSLSTRKLIKASLPSFGISLEEHEIINIFDFYEIYYAIEYFTQTQGPPLWINTTAGPGLAISALSAYALKQKVDLLAYDEIKDVVRLISIEKLKKLQKCRNRYFPTLKAIGLEVVTLNELINRLSLSRSTLTRQLQMFKKLNLIEITGSGNGYSPYKIKLTEWGSKFISYSENRF